MFPLSSQLLRPLTVTRSLQPVVKLFVRYQLQNWKLLPLNLLCIVSNIIEWLGRRNKKSVLAPTKQRKMFHFLYQPRAMTTKRKQVRERSIENPTVLISSGYWYRYPPTKKVTQCVNFLFGFTFGSVMFPPFLR